MKLYDGGRAPNPRRVSVFLAEKGVEVERVPVDMAQLGHKSAEVTGLNPLQPASGPSWLLMHQFSIVLYHWLI